MSSAAALSGGGPAAPNAAGADACIFQLYARLCARHNGTHVINAVLVAWSSWTRESELAISLPPTTGAIRIHVPGAEIRLGRATLSHSLHGLTSPALARFMGRSEGRRLLQGVLDDRAAWLMRHCLVLGFRDHHSLHHSRCSDFR